MALDDIYIEKKLMKSNHILWKIENTVDFSSFLGLFQDLETEVGRAGYGVEVGLRALFLQFFYDLSDRQIEERVDLDLSYRWFCKFTMYDKVPDHSFFGRFRDRVGTQRIGELFRSIMNIAKEKSLLRSVFYFVDSTAIESKKTTWKERDMAIQNEMEKSLDSKDTDDRKAPSIDRRSKVSTRTEKNPRPTGVNNTNIANYATDTDARFGCKGKRKYWYGYKGHVGIDMGSGLIEKAAITPANVPDPEGFKHVCPRDGQMVFADKAYSLKPAQQEMRKRGATSAAILKHNMLGKNKDLDKWRSKIRSPFENVFSQIKKRARYRGIAKMQFQFFMDAMVYNVKRLVAIHDPPIIQGA